MIRRFAFILLIFYTLLSGATYSGILDARYRLWDVVIVAVVLLIWILSRRRWKWYSTPLDWAIPIWIAAFTISLSANLDMWRRIAIGLWFVGLYIGVWYLLQDAFANGGLRREWLIDGMLIAGVPVMFVGYAQIWSAGLNQLLTLRPVGTLGNANALAAFLVMLLPFMAGRLYRSRSPLTRVLLTVYGLAALGLLALSYSRGGWIAGVVALAVWAGLSLPLRQWWTRLGVPVRGLIIVLMLGSAAVIVYAILESFGIAGRSVELRAWIYETAIHLFAQHPITGTGLFTFGAGLSRLNALPPAEPHSHAHNIILDVAAEMGVVGLLALAVTTIIALRVAWRVRRDRIAVMGIASFAGFAAHQMFDMPIMMPALALMALAALALFVPTAPQPASRFRWMPIAVTVSGLVIAGLGIWNALNYREYVDALSSGISSGDYSVAATRLQTLSNADPSFSIYDQQIGMLLGLQATGGDLQAAQAGASSFERYTALEPDYASGFANLAALDEQIGKLPEAVAAMQKAAALAPQWSLVYRAGVYAEAAGDLDSARADYQQAASIYHDISLLPEWNDSPVRRAMQFSPSSLTPLTQAILALVNGDPSSAQQIWTAAPDHTADVSDYHVLALMLALSRGDHATAQAQLQAAQKIVGSSVDQSWVDLGTALYNPAQFDSDIASARKALVIAPTSSDWVLGQNIAYIQYLQLAIPRQFLPQVGYSEIDAPLAYLLNNADALAKLRAALHE